jgi:uncharacterized SAM-binding protein YcdF (DUF218 family)
MKCPCLSRRARRIAAATTIMAALCGAFMCRDALLASAGEWLNIGTPLTEPVDEVMVLGGEAITRPFVAAAVIRAGLSSKVLVVRTPQPPELDEERIPPQHEIIRQVLIRSGVSPDAILLLAATVDSTDQEAQCLADYLEEHPGHRVAVVTSDFHTRRTRLLFGRICRRHAEGIHFIGAPTDSFNGTNWWKFETGFVYYVNEYLKLVKALAQ